MDVDVSNVRFPTKEDCRDMSTPSAAAYDKPKRLARYTAGFEEVRFNYETQDEEEALNMRGFIDSDWAGCWKSRKSTSSGPIMLEKH